MIDVVLREKVLNRHVGLQVEAAVGLPLNDYIGLLLLDGDAAERCLLA